MSKTDWDAIPEVRGEPNFNNLLAVLKCQMPNRPTLFEFFLNDRLYSRLATKPPTDDDFAHHHWIIEAFRRVGYDYATVAIPGFSFLDGWVLRPKLSSVSLNVGNVIHTREEFDRYTWPDPKSADYDILNRLADVLPKGLKLIPYSPDGVLENVTELVGYENLCIMIKEDPGLAYDIFEGVGSNLVQFFDKAARYDTVGACIVNDDWGFKTQTMFSPTDMRKFVFPWIRKIVEAIHTAGKPAILHSCGHFDRIISDIIDDLKFDGRHSYEDAIMPVEEAYERYHQHIAIMGGIDVNFICLSSPEDVYQRSKSMLDRSTSRGAYALGTGNSVPEYVPDSSYFAMIRAALDQR